MFKNQEFNDINDNHVGVDVNSLTSFTSYEAGFWRGENENEKFEVLSLIMGKTIKCGLTFWIRVLMLLWLL